MRRLLILSVVFLMGCERQTPEPLPPTEFQGILLRGTAAEAKAAGYRKCESAGGTSFYCSRDLPTSLFGVQASNAVVTLSVVNPTGDEADKSLEFWDVRLSFEPVALRRGCELTDPADPNACATDRSAPLAELERRLLADGWSVSRKIDERQYVKAGTLVTIDVHPDTGKVDVNSVFAGYPESVLAEIAKEPPVVYRDPEGERAAFIESMAK
jgi:hypothetical protein